MLFEEMLKDAREEGRTEGRIEGRTEVINTMSQLIQLLIKQNRMNDVLKLAKDRDYLEKLLKEFNLDN